MSKPLFLQNSGLGNLKTSIFGSPFIIVMMGISSAVLLSAPTQSFAGTTLTPEQIYTRCYSQIVRSPVPANDSVMAQVKAGTKAPVDACMGLLSLGNLNSNNMLANTTDPRGVQVLKTFLNLHRSWFPENNFQLQLPTSNYSADQDLYDANSPAYFPTHALFAPNGQFNEIVTAKAEWQAVRVPQFTPGGSQVNNVGTDGNLYSSLTFFYRTGTPQSSVSPWTPPYYTPRGTFMGLQAPVSMPFTAFYTNPMSKTQPTIIDNKMATIEATQSMGGGALGVPSYLMLTDGRLVNDIDDGGRLMKRRWTLSFLKDLMCRTAPVLRDSDVTAMVQPSSTLPFRQSSNCMQCHGTLDGAAASARNVVYFPDNVAPNVSRFDSLHLYHFTPTSSVKTLPSTVDFQADFYNQQPQGQLFYRSYDGTLVNQSVVDIQGLGQAMAQNNDLYLCAASRYFNFFTGISIYIGDYTDPSAPAPTATELTNRNFVIQLGQQLKTNQSISQLFKTIMSSPYYSQSDYGMGGN